MDIGVTLIIILLIILYYVFWFKVAKEEMRYWCMDDDRVQGMD